MKLPAWIGRKERREQELDEEIRSHLAMAIRERIENGEDPAEAEANARREFGNATMVKEVTREMWGWRWLEMLLQDLRYGLRQLRRDPGFTAVAIITLALGIGANTAIFSVVSAVLLRPLPYPDPSRLVTLWERSADRGIEQEKVSGPDFIDWRQQDHLFEDMAFWFGGGEFNLVTPRVAERVQAIYASSLLFSVLRVKPLLGRTFLQDEDHWHGNRVALISYGLWQNRFGSDPRILGRVLTVDSYGRKDYTIVGVMRPGFQFPGDCDLWLPAGWMGVHHGERRSAHWYSVIARLKPGVTLNRAQSEMDTIQSRIGEVHPADLIGSQVVVGSPA